MKRINLTKNKDTIVDDDVYEWASKTNWYYGSSGYACNRNSKRMLYLYREIMNAPKGSQIDHINGNKLDNRKENLRFCNYTENTRNRDRQHNNKSGYKGVWWCNYYNRWHSQITVDKKTKHVGYFASKEEAARAYNKAAIKYFGEFARLNKIEEDL